MASWVGVLKRVELTKPRMRSRLKLKMPWEFHTSRLQCRHCAEQKIHASNFTQHAAKLLLLKLEWVHLEEELE